MQIHVDQPNHLENLLAFLRNTGWSALHVDGFTLEVEMPETTDERAERLRVGTYVRSWQASHPEAEAKLVG